MIAWVTALTLLSLSTLAASAPSKAEVFSSCLHPVVSYRPGGLPYGNSISLGYVTQRGYPVAVVPARSTSDVSRAIRCARLVTLRVCARSGGHAFDGRSLCDGAVQIDLGAMRKTTVNAAGIATIQAGATLGESIWAVHAAKRWYGAGVCPGVGVGGYILGGGHGPFEGRLGVACDSLESVTMVTRDGDVIEASKTLRQKLFWGMCGAGGAQFGIITEFRLQTAPSAPFDNSVIFGFQWPHERIGELIESWAKYDEYGGDVWVRINMSDRRNGQSYMRALGACFNVNSVAECEKRLNRSAFYHVPERKKMLVRKVRDARDVLAFFGPGGAWGRRFPKDLYKNLVDERYKMKAMGNRVTDQSAFLSLGANPPSAAFWQRYANYCADADLKTKPWRTCQMNLFQNAVDKKRWNAFPHRGARIISHFSVGFGTPADRMKAYRWMTAFLKPYTTGVYVNYQDQRLGKSYPKLYWGKNLRRLGLLKTKYDPDYFFANPQPIPKAFGPW